MKRILITGGSGFIGSHTCLLLLEKGYELLVIDSFVNSSPKAIERVVKLTSSSNYNSSNNIKILKVDLRDKKSLDQIFSSSIEESKPIEAVIHFAGLKSVNESTVNPLLYWDANVNGSINLFNSMASNNCNTIVFSSSATIYGRSNKHLIDENTQPKPINPYGSTKFVIEQLLNDLFNSNPKKWRIANLRYFNPIGAHHSGLIGEDPLGVPDNLFPFITQVSSSKLKELKIFGNNWPTQDGTGVRDYIHVVDLAEGHISALNYLLNGTPKVINLNLGTGKGTSVLELVKTFERVNNINVPYIFAKRREGDLSRIVADNSLALSTLDWYPIRTLEDMCRDGWKWQSNNPMGYR